MNCFNPNIIPNAIQSGIFILVFFILPAKGKREQMEQIEQMAERCQQKVKKLPELNAKINQQIFYFFSHRLIYSRKIFLLFFVFL